MGPARAQRFWELYEDVRLDCDYVDLPRTLERYSYEFPDEVAFPAMADAVLSYPFRAAAFDGAHDVLRYAGSTGSVAILSDGDPVYQPAKIARAGFTDVIDGPVLVFARKEDHLDEVRRRVPADHHVIVDDKPRILAAFSRRLGDKVTTLHVCQGAYSHAREQDEFAPADLTVDHIADILDIDLDTLQGDRP